MDTISQWATFFRDRANQASDRRYLVGIAGIPGSGKSTLAAALTETMNLVQPGIAVCLPMDGFHLSNAELSDRNLISRKGSPSTFDFEAFSAVLDRARDLESSFAFPVYDRGLHEPVLDPDSENWIRDPVKVVVTEGNYLLLDQAPWREISGLLDYRMLLDTPKAQSHRWLISRHTQVGRDLVSAEEHYQRTDYPNTELVISCQLQPDAIVTWEHLGSLPG